MYGKVAPINKPENTVGSFRGREFVFCNLELCKNPPYKAIATKAAEPIANPLPIAAVVFPAASKASVLYLTYSPNSPISAIPPALSDIGPYPSIARDIGKLDSIPKAAKAIP